MNPLRLATHFGYSFGLVDRAASTKRLVARRLAFLLALAVGTLAVAAPAHARNGIVVGAAESGALSRNLAVSKAKMDLARLAGLDTIRMSAVWPGGASTPSPEYLRPLENAVTAAQLSGIRVVIAIFPQGSRVTPRTAAARARFAAFAANLVRALPWVEDVIIGNEPNLNRFWMPQFTRRGGNAAAPSYVALLARTYDALKAVSRDINVIGGALSPRGSDNHRLPRHTHSPTKFILDMGRAYRASRRRAPIMDAFANHPYQLPSRAAPSRRHPRSTTIAIADYDKLVGLLRRAFDGTAQPGSTLPIYYAEYGVQSQIPLRKRRYYTNLRSPAARDAVSEQRQAAYYRSALAMAQCQPNVAGMFIFHVSDERDARAWQSGLFYADDTPKPSLAPVRAAVRLAQEGRLARCRSPKRFGVLERVVFPEEERVAHDHEEWKVELECDGPCEYRASIRAVPEAEPEPEPAVANGDRRTGAVLLASSGQVNSEEPHVAELPAERLPAGTYQYVIRVFQVRKPGTAVVRLSAPFTVEEEPPAPPPSLPEGPQP